MSNIKKLKNELSEKERAKKQSNEILNEIQCFSQNHICDNLNEYKDFSENQTNENLNEVQYYPEEQKKNEEYYFSKNQIYTKNNHIKNLNMEEKRIIPISKDKVGKDDLHLDNPLNKYDSDDVLKGKRNILSDRVKYKNYKISLPENQPNKRILYTSANESNHNQIENKDEIDNNLKSTVNINNGYILEPNNINKLSQNNFNENIKIHKSSNIKNNISSSENIITTNTNTNNILDTTNINNNKDPFYFNNKQQEQILEKEYAVNNELSNNNNNLNCHPIVNKKIDNETNSTIMTNTGLKDSLESDDSCHCHCHCNCRGCCSGCDCDDFCYFCCIGCCEGCAKGCCIIY